MLGEGPISGMEVSILGVVSSMLGMHGQVILWETPYYGMGVSIHLIPKWPPCGQKTGTS